MNTATFKTNFKGGTRPNRFVVSGSFPAATATNTTNTTNTTSAIPFTFHVRATFIPPITNITLTAHAFGRKVNIPGDREYAPWQITVYDDFEHGTQSATAPKNLWTLFHKWHNAINENSSNMPQSPVTRPYINYKTDWTLEQLDLNGSATPLKKFRMIGCWPKTVGDIDFNMTRRNFLNTFSVIMLYDSIDITGTTTV